MIIIVIIVIVIIYYKRRVITKKNLKINSKNKFKNDEKKQIIKYLKNKLKSNSIQFNLIIY